MDFLTWQKDRYRKREGHESVTRKSSEACEKKEAEPPRWDVRSTAASRHWAQNRWLEIKDWSGFLQASSMCSFFPCSGGVGLLYILVILGNFNYKYPIINQLKTVQSQVSAVMLIQLFHPGEALIHPETLTLQDSNFSGYFKFNLISPRLVLLLWICLMAGSSFCSFWAHAERSARAVEHFLLSAVCSEAVKMFKTLHDPRIELNLARQRCSAPPGSTS